MGPGLKVHDAVNPPAAGTTEAFCGVRHLNRSVIGAVNKEEYAPVPTSFVALILKNSCDSEGIPVTVHEVVVTAQPYVPVESTTL
jgi:hypothetical protein